MIDKLEIHTKAQECRELLGEDANSPVDIFALASQIDKLTLVYYPLGARISGMCIKDTYVRLIAINAAMSYGRQRFSLAHEFYHLFYDKPVGLNVCAKSLEPKTEVEKCADLFATFFLAPYKSLRDQVQRLCKGEKPRFPEIIALEQYFGMSHQAMLYRLAAEKFISQADVENYMGGVVYAARCLGYDDRLYRPAPIREQKATFGYYLKQVEALRERELVSDGKLDELLLDAYRDDIVFGDDDLGGEAVD